MSPDAPRCSYCATLLRTTKPGRPTRRLTRDHILPRCMGRSISGVRNTRFACERCNALRAQVGHCPGVLSIVLHMARECSGDTRRAAQLLGVWKQRGHNAA